MFRKSFIAISTLAALVSASPATSDTYVGGDLEIEVEVGDVTTEAAFNGDAETAIGTINDGSRISGDVEIKVKTGDVTTRAAFMGDACTSIASIGGCQDD